jgi:hypothetical protein
MIDFSGAINVRGDILCLHVEQSDRSTDGGAHVVQFLHRLVKAKLPLPGNV